MAYTDTEQKTLHKKFIPTIRRIAIETLKIAAIFLIGIFVTKQFVEQKKVEDIQIQTIHVPTGQRAELTLADGTHVWLNSRSTLKFPNKFGTNKRNVELNGEGYFSVHHDKNVLLPYKPKNTQFMYWVPNLMLRHITTVLYLRQHY